MTPPRGSRRSFGSSRGRRRSSWETGPGDGIATITDTTPSFIGSVANATLDGLTLARIRGRVFFYLNSAAAAGDFIRGAIGLGLTSSEGTAAGIASVPTPVTEISAETWLWWDFFSMRSVTDAEAINQGGMAQYMLEIDTKAMRKMNVGDSLYLAVEASAVSGTISLTMTVDTRALVLLP